MTRRFLGVLLFVTLLLASNAMADTLMFDWGFNIDGTKTGFPGFYGGMSGLPSNIDVSGFDQTTGIGSIVVELGQGSHYLDAFFDMEIDNSVNGPYNEWGEVVGTPAPKWEIDEPGWNTSSSYPMGDIFNNMQANTLDNFNALPITNAYDVSMALGWNFTVPVDKKAVITLNLSKTLPSLGNYLAQHDLDSNDIIYYSGSIDVVDIPPIGPQPVPEPSTLVLLGSGLVGAIWASKRRFRKSINKGQGRPFSAIIIILVIITVVAAPQFASAAAPVVKTVQFLPGQPTAPHPAMCGVPLTFKGTSDQTGTYSWDPADGTSLISGTISNPYVIEATYTYTAANGCAVGKIYPVTLTVKNSALESAQKIYYVQIFDKTLEIEADRAIDEGLWALHRDMSRSTGTDGKLYGNWSTWSGWRSLQAANTEAFFSMGHKETGSADNPYTETVQRAVNTFFTYLAPWNIGTQALGNPDLNSNSIGISLPDQGNYGYQTGMFLSALVASDNPDGIAQTGPANIINRKYKDIAQDIADWIVWSQYDDNNYGGWRYNYNEWPDNSACQWNAIGLLAAERNTQWGIQVPTWAKTANKNWLINSHNNVAGNGWYGAYGYTGIWPEWGGLADTASGLVQLVWNGIGRDDPDGLWNSAEAFLRNNWSVSQGTAGYVPMRTNYLYAAFSFSKAMLLTSPKITMLRNSPSDPGIDWYGDPNVGLARALINIQYAPPSGYGYWWYNQPAGDHYAYMTAWAIMMLNRTVIETGRPVAVAKVLPPVAAVGQTIVLDGGDSYHQAVGRNIVAWNWTIYDGDTSTYPVLATGSGRTFPYAFSSLKNYKVKLVVTDDATPAATAETYITAFISVPPLKPVAIAGGPYRFCNQATPWKLDGSRSYNPDDGQHDPGAYPGDFIAAYEWDLDLNGSVDKTGSKPDVTSYFTGKPAGSYLIRLTVEDNSALSFPLTQGSNLVSDPSAATVILEGDCGCVSNLAVKIRGRIVDLSWQNVGATSYNIYRKLSTDANYALIKSGVAATVYTDTTALGGKTYNYVVKPYIATYNPPEYCTSNTATAVTTIGR